MAVMADAKGVVVELERLVDVGGVDGEGLPRHRCPVEAPGALVEVPETGGIEAELGAGRGCVALSRARNRSFRGIQREIHDRAPRSAPWSRRRAFGGIEPADEGGDHQGCVYGAAVGLQGDLVRHPGNEDAVRRDAGADPVEIVWTACGLVQPAAWPRRRPGPGQGDSHGVPMAMRWRVRPVTTGVVAGRPAPIVGEAPAWRKSGSDGARSASWTLKRRARAGKFSW